MTLFDRALNKAYALRSAPRPEPPSPPVPVFRGWVARLRTPSGATAKLAEPAPAEKTGPGIAKPGMEAAPTATPASPNVPRAPMSDAGIVPLAGSMDPRDDVVFPPEPFPSDLVVRVDPSHAEMVDAEIDPGWRWPAITDRLLASKAESGLIHLAGTLLSSSVERRIRSIAVSGCGRKAGRTTLLLALTRLIVERSSCRVLLVDFDFENPTLASDLGHAPAADIAHVAYGENSADEVLIELVPQRLGFLPLCHPLSPAELTQERIVALRDMLRGAASKFDLTLVDLGPIAEKVSEKGTRVGVAPPMLESRLVDACLGVARHPAESPGVDVAACFQQAGIEFLGTVETFTPVVPQNEPHFIR